MCRSVLIALFACIFGSNLVNVDATVHSAAAAAKAHPDHQKTLKYLTGIAIIRSEQSGIIGTLYFNQTFGAYTPLNITGQLFGLPPGPVGMHVHDWGNFTDYCHSVGYHFNADWYPHGGLNDHLRHNGDLGNVQNGQVNLSTDRLSLFGRNNIFGRSVVIHNMPDDLGRSDAPRSKLDGNSGDKIACGIVAKFEVVYA